MDQTIDTSRLTELNHSAEIDELDANELVLSGEELPEELLDLAVGAMRAIMPTFCWHTDPPHVEDYIQV